MFSFVSFNVRDCPLHQNTFRVVAEAAPPIAVAQHAQRSRSTSADRPVVVVEQSPTGS